MFPLSPSLWLAVGAAVLIAGLGVAVKVQTSRLDAVKQEYATFKAEVKATGETAQKAADLAAAARKQEIAKQEKANVLAQAAIRRRYDDFIASLRSGASGNNSSTPAPDARVCSDDAGNKRLSDALENFEIGTAQLLAIAEQQAAALITLREAWPK